MISFRYSITNFSLFFVVWYCSNVAPQRTCFTMEHSLAEFPSPNDIDSPGWQSLISHCRCGRPLSRSQRPRYRLSSDMTIAGARVVAEQPWTLWAVFMACTFCRCMQNGREMALSPSGWWDQMKLSPVISLVFRSSGQRYRPSIEFV